MAYIVKEGQPPTCALFDVPIVAAGTVADVLCPRGPQRDFAAEREFRLANAVRLYPPGYTLMPPYGFSAANDGTPYVVGSAPRYVQHVAPHHVRELPPTTQYVETAYYYRPTYPLRPAGQSEPWVPSFGQEMHFEPTITALFPRTEHAFNESARIYDQMGQAEAVESTLRIPLTTALAQQDEFHCERKQDIGVTEPKEKKVKTLEVQKTDEGNKQKEDQRKTVKEELETPVSTAALKKKAAGKEGLGSQQGIQRAGGTEKKRTKDHTKCAEKTKEHAQEEMKGAPLTEEVAIEIKQESRQQCKQEEKGHADAILTSSSEFSGTDGKMSSKDIKDQGADPDALGFSKPVGAPTWNSSNQRKPPSPRPMNVVGSTLSYSAYDNQREDAGNITGWPVGYVPPPDDKYREVVIGSQVYLEGGTFYLSETGAYLLGLRG